MCFFFFKQKTAYEMRISDWSSDVCSSDLISLPSRARSDARGDVDRLAFGQADDRLLHVAARIGLALPALGLALGDQRVDAEHLDVEQRLDGRLDRRLRRVARDAKDDGVILAEQRRDRKSQRLTPPLMRN